MKKSFFKTCVYLAILSTSFVGLSYASMLMIRMKDGRVITLDTSKITSMSFEENGQSGENGDFGPSYSGNWTSSEGGSMTINQEKTDFRARYAASNGRILGKMNGSSMEGYWVQDSSGKRCSSMVDNSYYWGRIRLNFTSQSYSGHWGYCDDEPRLTWSGAKK
jgi:hypothetical protein